MVFGYRRFTSEDYSQFKKLQQIHRDSQEDADKIYGLFETNFIYLGITAVEDQLQANV